jgi:hypothetical protein
MYNIPFNIIVIFVFMGGYQFQILLQDIQPPIWRRIIVPSNIHLVDFVWAIICAMQWRDFCKWRFIVNNTICLPDYHDVNIYDLFSLFVKDFLDCHLVLQYKYVDDDINSDTWKHSIQYEGEVPDFNKDISVCIDGTRACPWDHFAFAKEYNEYVDIIRDKNYPNRDFLMSLYCGRCISNYKDYEDYDPDFFDINSVVIYTAGHKKQYCNNNIFGTF